MRRRQTVFATFVAGLVLVACGGDGDGQATDVPPTADTPSQTAPSDTPSSDDTAPADDAGEDVLRVAFVYVEPVGEAGWTSRHEAGRAHLEDVLGNRVETTVVEEVPEGADGEAVFDELAAQGHELIFGTSAGYGDAMLAVSGRYPDVAFEHAGGTRTTDNLGTYTGAVEQTRYLEGMAAGAVTETGQLGFVAAFPSPEVVRGINAYTLGAREVRPDAHVQVAWTSTWFDPDVETDAARSLIDAGADVLGMHQSSTATGEVASAAGAAWTGAHADRSDVAPESWLTGTIWDWGGFYVSVAESVLDGTWSADAYVGDLADGVVSLAPFGETVDADTRDRIDRRRLDLREGAFDVFTGPIADASGAPRLDDGEQLDRTELETMDWFVEGVLEDVV